MIPLEAKMEIRRLFGEDGFMVRKDMVDNAVGYRGYSISEAWTGPSDLAPEVRKAVRDVATALMGENENAGEKVGRGSDGMSPLRAA
jgi:hypothetical protein